MVNRIIGRFSVWFASAGAVWQTTTAVLIAVAVDALDPRLDPHGFLVLYVLTVYSAITQPALAFAANVAAQKAALASVGQEQLLRELANMQRLLLAIAERLEDTVEDIAEAHGTEVECDE